MKRILAPILVLTLLFPSLALSDSSKVIETTKAQFQKETQVVAVVFQPGEVVEWKLVVDGRVFKNSAGNVTQSFNVRDSLRKKTWNGFASAMCNILYQTGYAKKSDKKSHVIRVVDGLTLQRTNYHWKKSSLGSCNCKTWAPFDN